MDATAIVDVLRSALPGATLEVAPTNDLQSTFYVSRDDVRAALKELRDQPSLRFVFLSEIVGLDYWPREPRFELDYILVSLEHRLRVRMKVRLDGSDAHVATVSDMWPAANWLEREIWDLFGIEFDGHPDPRRLLMPEDWEGFPLRKDYPVQIRKTPDASEPMQVTEEEFRASLQRDRLTRK